MEASKFVTFCLQIIHCHTHSVINIIITFNICQRLSVKGIRRQNLEPKNTQNGKQLF